jgi:hypothetical protein
MDEFDKALLELGWRRVDVARRLGLTSESISRWKVAPRYVMAYLESMLCIKRLRELAAAQLQP